MGTAAKNKIIEFSPGRVGYTFEIPNLNFLVRQNRTGTALPMSPHRLQPSVLGFTFLIKGQQSIRVNQQNYKLRGGDVLVTFPNEVYSTGGTPQEKSLFYHMQLRLPRTGDAFFGLPKQSDRALAQALWRIHPRRFHGSPAIGKLLAEIDRKCRQPWSALQDGWVANQIVTILFEVIECAQRAAATPPSLSMQDLVRYIAERLQAPVSDATAAPLTVPKLATRAGLSVSRFEAKFKEEIGMPPGEYVLRARVDESKRRLARGKTTVTETAFALGFPSSQYFATVFKRYTGQRPSALCKKPASSAR